MLFFKQINSLSKRLLFIGLSLVSFTSLAALPTIELKAGNDRIQVEVASTPASQQVGLMYRPSMPQNQGMLFMFSEKAGHCFWMKNTLIPLSIAFIGDDGRIVNIEEMDAQTENNHCPLRPIRFALEMNKAWFSQKKLGPGSLIEGLPRP